MSRDRSDRCKYSAETETTVGSDRVAYPVVPSIEDVPRLHQRSYQDRKPFPKAEDAVREVKEAKETLPETLEQRLDRTEVTEAEQRFRRKAFLDFYRSASLRHCFSTPGDGVVSSQALMRLDVVALGFPHFETRFEPDRVLCIFENSDKHVSLVFFHVEGMATLFGVGLPFSKVLLKEDSVEVREVHESVWRGYWKEQTGRKSYPLLFDVARRGNKSQQESASPGPKNVLSTEVAAECLGVGVEGLNEFTGMTTELENVSQNVHTEQPEWLSLIYNFLWEDGASDWHSVTTAYSKELHTASDSNGLSGEGAVSTSDTSPNAPQTFLSISNNFISLLRKGLSGFGLDSREKSGSQIDYRQLRLTVKVYLDPSGYSFSKLPETAELPFDRESGKVKIRVSENTLELSDYEMVPTVVISFFYDPTLKNSRGKRLLTSLNSRFHIDSCISDENVFGWYHDRLRLSFSCRGRNEVMREKRPAEEEILSQHERRFAGKERGSDNSTVVLKGRGKEYELVGGYQPIAQVRLKGSTNNETTKGNTSRDHFAHQIVAICLKDANFAIKNVEAGSQELAYEATIFPPVSFYDVWDLAERELAEASGMMSNVELEVEGKWIVKGQDDTLSSRPSLCAYEFLCQRRLAQHREVIRTPVKTRKFWKQEEGGKKEYTEIVLQQKLSKQFLLNHSFSHMNFQKFQRLESYEWDMAKQTFSPLKEIIDLPPSSSSSSLPTTSV